MDASDGPAPPPGVVTNTGPDLQPDVPPDLQLDLLDAGELVDVLLNAESRVLPAVRAATAQLVVAIELVADVVRAEGRLAFVGAGTSGRLAAAEVAELPGTFGLPPERCLALIAGRGPIIDDAAEDDAAAGTDAVAGLGPADVLVAVAASGSTPYTLAAARAARTAGVPVVAVVSGAGSPLAALASAPIEVVVGDEALRGSTRLSAGTAQKIALNTLTTAAMARAGRVHGNLMIDVVAANVKLRARAAGIVAQIVGCSPRTAREALDACDQDARAAVVHLVRGLSPSAARERAGARVSLRAALTE